MVFYPDASSVKIDKVVLDEGSSSNPTTNATTTKQNPTTTATTAAASGDDKTANITTGTQTGTAGDKQLYAEFAPTVQSLQHCTTPFLLRTPTPAVHSAHGLVPGNRPTST